MFLISEYRYSEKYANKCAAHFKKHTLKNLHPRSEKRLHQI